MVAVAALRPRRPRRREDGHGAGRRAGRRGRGRRRAPVAVAQVPAPGRRARAVVCWTARRRPAVPPSPAAAWRWPSASPSPWSCTTGSTAAGPRFPAPRLAGLERTGTAAGPDEPPSCWGAAAASRAAGRRHASGSPPGRRPGCSCRSPSVPRRAGSRRRSGQDRGRPPTRSRRWRGRSSSWPSGGWSPRSRPRRCTAGGRPGRQLWRSLRRRACCSWPGSLERAPACDRRSWWPPRSASPPGAGRRSEAVTRRPHAWSSTSARRTNPWYRLWRLVLPDGRSPRRATRCCWPGGACVLAAIVRGLAERSCSTRRWTGPRPTAYGSWRSATVERRAGWRARYGWSASFRVREVCLQSASFAAAATGR